MKNKIICSRFMKRSGDSFWRKGVMVNRKGSGRGGRKGAGERGWWMEYEGLKHS